MDIFMSQPDYSNLSRLRAEQFQEGGGILGDLFDKVDSFFQGHLRTVLTVLAVVLLLVAVYLLYILNTENYKNSPVVKTVLKEEHTYLARLKGQLDERLRNELLKHAMIPVNALISKLTGALF